MLVLGLETSCDDTGVGIVDAEKNIRANVVASQLAAHKPYGGVVPEIAARAHLDVIDDAIAEALKTAGADFSDLSAVAATTGPGLIGGVMVGSMMGKAISAVCRLPFISVNHLEAHALTARLTNNIDFPYLLLLASGGHCQLLLVRGVGNYRLLGTTIDDAIGECFDKCAKMLGLGYPGGPLIEEAATQGNRKTFALPRPMLGRQGCDFSFSGLKTSVRTALAGKELTPSLVADMAASLQAAIADSVADRARKAFAMLKVQDEAVTAFVAAGGVAANRTLCARLTSIAQENGVTFVSPPPRLCTDNGAMVAWAGLERFRLGLIDTLDIRARPRWPLEEVRGMQK
ncbi:MAG: tRNA (adenosine(37)-N6)-threonylcarbamoyltransferase complex transferase subunit TsaD [Alphaproteobacteria bacterium]|nr:tRNA (adenosine(37)-N6)-threonylcarbamoyltransferase complex transferase subunit TsaD [Alphaproteobacteria bacterium]